MKESTVVIKSVMGIGVLHAWRALVFSARMLALMLPVFILPAAELHAARPLVGIAGIETRSPRTMTMAGVTVRHLSSILESTGVFSQIEAGQLNAELTKYGCVEEACMLRFARAARLGLLVAGSVEERGDEVEMELRCYGIETPYGGKLLYRYRARFPIGKDDVSSREINYLCEEHAAGFVAGVLRSYRRAVPLVVEGGRVTAPDAPGPPGAEYTVYRYDSPAGDDGLPVHYHETGRVHFRDDGMGTAEGTAELRPGDFIFFGFSRKADELEAFTEGRKKEIVFERPSPVNTAYVFLFTVPASALMPVMAPLGYYGYGDYAGLALWAISIAPYLYLEIHGLADRPDEYRDKRRDVPRETAIRYNFSLYMLLAGGAPLFVDAFAHQYLYDASLYRGTRQLMGNPWTALYLGIVSSGGGHFYRGERLWGYLYFHAETLLVYFITRSLTPGRYYNEADNSYSDGRTDRKAGYSLIGALCAVKIVEILHVMLTKDRIRGGTVSTGRFSMEPLLYLDDSFNPVGGLRCTMRY